MSIPFFAIGNNELAQKKPIGKTVKCKVCGKRHRVKYGKIVNKDGTMMSDTTLGIVDCGKRSFMVSITGKKI